jgi:hypothetical protein
MKAKGITHSQTSISRMPASMVHAGRQQMQVDALGCFNLDAGVQRGARTHRTVLLQQK